MQQVQNMLDFTVEVISDQELAKRFATRQKELENKPNGLSTFTMQRLQREVRLAQLAREAENAKTE